MEKHGRILFEGSGMEEESYRDFITGLGEEIRMSGMTQADLAKRARASYTNLSKVLNFKSGCSPKWRRNVCAALGTTEEAVIARGHRGLTPAPAPAREETTPISPANILSGVASLVEELRVEKEKHRFWTDLFEFLPCSVTILRDGVVISQNHESRRICPAVVGKELCQTCKEDGQEEAVCSNCPISDPLCATGDKSQFRKDIKGEPYLVNVDSMKINSVEYQVIMTTKL